MSRMMSSLHASSAHSYLFACLLAVTVAVVVQGKVQDLTFSPNEKFLASLGGRDDNKIVIWDLETGAAICGSSASNETCNTIRFLNHSDFMLVSGGHYNLRVWAFDLANRKIRPADCQLGQLKRVINSISIDEEDKFMYCGTATGDLLQVSLGPNLFKVRSTIAHSLTHARTHAHFPPLPSSLPPALPVGHDDPFPV